MAEKHKEVVIYFTNGRMVRLPEKKIRMLKIGDHRTTDVRLNTSDGQAVVNWDNVCYVREWQEPEDEYDL